MAVVRVRAAVSEAARPDRLWYRDRFGSTTTVGPVQIAGHRTDIMATNMETQVIPMANCDRERERERLGALYLLEWTSRFR